uniref:Predicted amidohydrolase n=1 Tax=Candidatus Kentrum sp. DK TaxID=2126562 RepID=A0A450S377_9GAMM|nr:MAG: Predicted amidohydrolase [Candidatus Kentron sp. DK]
MKQSNLSVVRTAAVQIEANANASAKILGRTASFLRRCAEEGCRLACLPEAFATSLDLPRLRALAEEIPGPTTEFLQEQALAHGLHLVAGIIERDCERTYSTSVLIDDDGEIIGKYRRMHLYSLEKHFLDPGNECRVFETRVGRLGLISGYDINFPEVSRLLFRQRVEIVLCPTQLLKEFRRAIHFLTIARAAENCCYVVLASSTGANCLANLVYLGHSLIVRNPITLNPYGMEYLSAREVLAQAQQEETMLMADLDLAHLRREQEENPHYEDCLPLSYPHGMET